MKNQTKSDAKRLLLVGCLLLLLFPIVPDPLGLILTLCAGAVCIGTGGSLYYREVRKEQQYRVNCLKYGNPA